MMAYNKTRAALIMGAIIFQLGGFFALIILSAIALKVWHSEHVSLVFLVCSVGSLKRN